MTVLASCTADRQPEKGKSMGAQIHQQHPGLAYAQSRPGDKKAQPYWTERQKKLNEFSSMSPQLCNSYLQLIVHRIIVPGTAQTLEVLATRADRLAYANSVLSDAAPYKVVSVSKASFNVFVGRRSVCHESRSTVATAEAASYA